jgi:Transposase DDE domain
VLLYAYAIGVRSSRQIQRRLPRRGRLPRPGRHQAPDHVTIARFRVRHEQALAGFLVQSLRLCAAAGLVRLGTVALDGTKLAANAAERANRTLAKVEEEVAEILRQAAEADQREDCAHGQERGDELPAALASKAGRLARPRQAKALLEAEAAERQQRYEQRVAELAAAARARGKRPEARIKPRARDEAPNPKRVANVTDPDSRLVRTRKGSLQGYNAQAVTTMEQVIVAAELTQQASDFAAARTDAGSDRGDLGGRRDPPAAGDAAGRLRLLDDRQPNRHPGRAGAADPAREAWPAGQAPQDGRPSESRSDGLRAAMTAKLSSEDGKARYALRKQTVEPVFGRIKDVRGARRLIRRGLRACTAEWKLLCGTPQPAQAVAAPSRPTIGEPDGHLSREQARHGWRRRTASTAFRRGLPRFARPPAPCSCRL